MITVGESPDISSPCLAISFPASHGRNGFVSGAKARASNSVGQKSPGAAQMAADYFKGT